MKKIQRHTQSSKRRGIVAVEFALMAPIFLAIIVGATKVAQMLDIQNTLALAAREGARLGSMDREGIVDEGVSSNEKIIQDVRNFLNSTGLPGDKANVTLTHHDNPEAEFDFDDPDNDLALFELTIEMPYNEVGAWDFSGSDEFKLIAKVVFRNSRATIVQ
jgi:hypothetical protein